MSPNSDLRYECVTWAGRATARRSARWVTASVCFVCIASLAGACAPTPPAPPLAGGVWTGDLVAPGVVAAIGFLARVPASGDAIDIIALEAMGFDGGPVTDLILRADTISFTWSSEAARACVLTEDAAGAFNGECTTTGDSAWTVRLAPPRLRNMPVGHARTIAARGDYGWSSTTHPWGRMYVPRTAGTADVRVSDVATRMQSGLDTVLSILGEADYDRPIDTFLVEGRPDLASLVGRPDGSTADPLGSTVILSKFGGLETIMRHEIMHVASINLWGIPPEPAAWIREGIATFAGGHCAGYGLHQLAANMMGSGELLPLASLIDGFYEHNDLITYLESGSLFQFVYEMRGRDFARRMWATGLEAVLAAEGQSLAGLEAEWRAMLARPDLDPAAVDWSRIRGIGCG